MKLFKAFTEYITSSPLKDAKIEIELLKKQLANKEEWLMIFHKQCTLIRAKFRNSQKKHSGYLYYRDKYLETVNELKDLKDIADHCKARTKSLRAQNIALLNQLEQLKQLKQEVVKKPILRYSPGLRHLLQENKDRYKWELGGHLNESTIKINTELQNVHIPNVIDNRNDDSYLTDEFKIGSKVLFYSRYKHHSPPFTITFIDYDNKIANIKCDSDIAKYHEIEFSELRLIPN